MRKWLPIVVLGLAQFVMVIDGTVMNVSITTVVNDLGTTVSAMQLAIATFTLTMAAFMLAGAGIGDRLGRRRTFVIGSVIYAVGSLITALAPGFATLFVGWSIVEGLGAVLVIPAIAALAATNYEGRDRAVAYGILGGIAGAAAAAGPLIGGWVTSEFSWRWVFAAETIIIALVILPLTPRVRDGARKAAPGRFDVVGVLLSAVAMGLIVLALVTASTWGLVRPINPPVEFFGFSPVIPIVLAGLVVGRIFLAWENRLADRGGAPLVGVDLLGIRTLRAGLSAQMILYFIIAGTFFVLPLYLQTVLGLDAFESGLRMLPMSVAILVMALAGSRLAERISPRTIIQAGIGLASAGVVLLIGSITPDARGALFALAMAVIGIGLGLAVSQIGNVNLSAADESRSSEIGGLQGTTQNLGSSLGVALAGTVLFIGLAATFTTNLSSQPAADAGVQAAAAEATASGIQVVSADQVNDAATVAGLPPAQVDAVVQSYEAAKLQSLRGALLIVFVVGVLGLLLTGGLPREPLGARGPPDA